MAFDNILPFPANSAGKRNSVPAKILTRRFVLAPRMSESALLRELGNLLPVEESPENRLFYLPTALRVDALIVLERIGKVTYLLIADGNLTEHWELHHRLVKLIAQGDCNEL